MVFKSKCCNADATIIFSPDFLGDDPKKMRVGTTYFECSKCNEPCDIKPIEEVVRRGIMVKAEINTINEEFEKEKVCKSTNKAEKLAKRFHEFYEELAPKYNYQTRKQSAVPWSKVPINNKRLMIAVCEKILKEVK